MCLMICSVFCCKSRRRCGFFAFQPDEVETPDPAAELHKIGKLYTELTKVAPVDGPYQDIFIKYLRTFRL